MANHRTQAELKPLYEKAMKLIDEGFSHTQAAEEVGLSQGALSRHVRKLEGTFKDNKQKKKKAAVAKKKGRPSKKSGVGLAKSEIEQKIQRPVQFTQLAVQNSGGRTLLIVTDDQDMVSRIVESFK